MIDTVPDVEWPASGARRSPLKWWAHALAPSKPAASPRQPAQKTIPGLRYERRADTRLRAQIEIRHHRAPSATAYRGDAQGDAAPSQRLILVQNFFEELKRLVPAN